MSIDVWSYKDLGEANGWTEGQEPPKYKKCRDLNHVPQSKPSSFWRCYTNYWCDKCRITWAVDSSD